MSRELLDVGNRLIAVWTQPNNEGQQDGASIKWTVVESITVDRLPGPMGWYLVAVIVFNDKNPDKIIPLHMAQTIEVLNP